MENFDRYALLHEEVMKRLENGEITTEQAKTLNNKFFDKYVMESDDIIEESVFNKKNKEFEKQRASAERITERYVTTRRPEDLEKVEKEHIDEIKRNQNKLHELENKRAKLQRELEEVNKAIDVMSNRIGNDKHITALERKKQLVKK